MSRQYRLGFPKIIIIIFFRQQGILFGSKKTSKRHFFYSCDFFFVTKLFYRLLVVVPIKGGWRLNFDFWQKYWKFKYYTVVKSNIVEIINGSPQSELVLFDVI